jgi:hypothetical protein
VNLINCCFGAGFWEQKKVEKTHKEESKLFKYMLAKVLPVLQQIEKEQSEELKIECKIQGILETTDCIGRCSYEYLRFFWNVC